VSSNIEQAYFSLDQRKLGVPTSTYLVAGMHTFSFNSSYEFEYWEINGIIYDDPTISVLLEDDTTAFLKLKEVVPPRPPPALSYTLTVLVQDEEAKPLRAYVTIFRENTLVVDGFTVDGEFFESLTPATYLVEVKYLTQIQHKTVNLDTHKTVTFVFKRFPIPQWLTPPHDWFFTLLILIGLFIS